MARLIRALLDALDGDGDDDDDDGAASSLSSAASSPPRPLSPPPPVAPRLSSSTASASATDDDVLLDMGDEVLEEVSNGFFRVVRATAPPPPPSGDEKQAAGSASASESEYFAAAVEGSSEEGFAGAGTVAAVDVFGAAAASGLEGGASDGVGGDGSSDGSFRSFRSSMILLDAAALGDSADHSDGSVMNNGDQGGHGAAARAGVVFGHFVGHPGGTDGGTIDHTEESDADLVLVGDESDAENSTSKHGFITSVQDFSHKHAASNASDAEDVEAQSDHGAPESVTISETEKTVELVEEELEIKATVSEDTFFGSDDSDADHVNDGDELLFGNDQEEELDGKEVDLFDLAALAELLRVADISPGHGKAEVFPAEISELRQWQLPPTVVSTPVANPVSTSALKVLDCPESEMTDEEKKLFVKVDEARIKYLRLFHRLGYDTEHRSPKEVSCHLGVAEGFRRARVANHSAKLESAWKRALQLEAEGTEGLELSCNVLVIGKTGVGKSATINSIFGEDRSKTDAFLPATSCVKEIAGVVCGVKFRVVDTPGLGRTAMDERSNRRVLNYVKKYINRCPPDIVLYVDRIDTRWQDADDLSLLRCVTSVLGLSVWSRTIIILTHSAACQPEEPSDSPVNHEMFAAHRTRAIQQSIWKAAKDARTRIRIRNRAVLVENHHLCPMNSDGEKLLPDGTAWRPELLLLCCSLKIAAELDGHSSPCAASAGLLSSLLESRDQPGGADCHPDDDLGTCRSPIELPSAATLLDTDHRFSGSSRRHRHRGAAANSHPAGLRVHQVDRDMEELSVHVECSVPAKNRGAMSMDHWLACTLRGETRLKSSRRSSIAGGLSMSFFSGHATGAAKVEDELELLSAGGDAARGASMLEAAPRWKKERAVAAALGASMAWCHGEWSVAASLDSELICAMGTSSTVALRLGVDSRRAARVRITASTSQQLAVGLLVVCSTAATHLWKKRRRPCADPPGHG